MKEHMFETFEGTRVRLRLIIDRKTARLWLVRVPLEGADAAPCRLCVTRARTVIMQLTEPRPLMRVSVLASDDQDFAFDVADDGARHGGGGGTARCQRCGLFWPALFATTSEARPKGPAMDLDDPALATGRRAARRRAAAAVLARRRAG